MRQCPTKASRQIHWCAEHSDSEDEQEITVSSVRIARCRNHIGNTSLKDGGSSKRKEEFGESPIRYSRVGSRVRMAIEPAIMIPIKVNGSRVDFELDTGASVSIIDETTWKKIGKPEIKSTKLEATAYNNSPISFDGRCLVNLQFEGRTVMMEVYVLHTANHPLCGRDMIRKLQIDCGPHVRSMEGKPCYTKEQLREKIKSLLEENQVLFQKGLGRCTTAKVSLKLKEGVEKPKFCRVRPVPIALRPKVEAKLQELVENGTLTRVEHSKWATPLVVVPKPGGKIRLCGDYKVTINPQLDINQYPLPKPDDLFHMLNGGKKFFKMDLSDAYMQLELEPESKKYTTINTHRGMFVYNRVPFGIASIPAIFQRIMETTLAGIEGVIIYLDDITVTAPDDVTHLARLREMLKRLREAGFKLKREKCEFLKEEMELLGHIVDGQGIRPSPKKVQAMLNMPEPKNLKEVESFLGMVQYYGKFIPNLSTLAAPLNGLRKKGVAFRWEEAQRNAVKQIKQRLTEVDVLTHYDPQIPVVLATDASEYGIGAVIYHKMPDGKEKVIAYASRTLTKEERNYSQIEKEALGIVYGVEKFNQFLYGRKFTLLTDHQPLVKIFGPKSGIPTIAAKRLHRWSLRLMIYSFDIEYRKTSEFGNADGLSRLPDPRELPSSQMVVNEVMERQMTSETWKDMVLNEQQVAKATQEDEILKRVYKYVMGGWPPRVKEKQLQPYEKIKAEINVYKGCLMWGSRVVIPKKFRRMVLGVLHHSHYGRNRMMALARRKVWYPGMDKDIQKMAQACDICAAFGNEMRRTPLHP
ncbi:hypothetical protein V3C99_018216 [Haemonchus contortus]